MKLRYLPALLLMLLPVHLSAREKHALPVFRSGTFAGIMQSAKGHPAIVHFWGVSCAPCLVELPDWGKLTQARPYADIHIVQAERMPPNPNLVREILGQSNLAYARNWVFGDDSHDRLRFEIDPEWQGELPMTILINPDGTTRTVIGTTDFAELQHWLDGWPSSGNSRRDAVQTHHSDELPPRRTEY